MTVSAGTHSLGPDDGSVEVETGRAGLGARLGHDLVLAAREWSATVTVDPADPAATRLDATVVVGSLAVERSRGGLKPLSGGDEADIVKGLRKVLSADRHPTISFACTHVDASATASATATALRLAGNLTVAGTTRPTVLDVAVADDGTVTATASVSHAAFGLTPYSAMLGALKVADEVVVRVVVRLPTT